MGFLTNTWVKYFDRTYQQIKDSVLTKFGYKVPEITDHTENNPHIQQISIFAGVTEQLGYYVDNAARESFIDSARLYQSAVSLAKWQDYKIIGNLPYTADVQFTSSIPAESIITIPAGTIVNAGTVPFVTQDDAIIAIGDTVSSSVGVSQYTQAQNVLIGTASGLPNMEIAFLDKIVHNSLIIRFSGITWTSKDTLAYSTLVDMDFVQTVNKYQQVVAYVGNGMSGAFPAAGEEIRADYKVTLGADGSAAAGAINTIVTVLTLPPGVALTVTNPSAATGGSNVESLEQIKSHLPLANRTLMRAVTPQDYIDIAELAPGVAKAGEYFACGKTVDMYIVPDGGGLASNVLLESTKAFMDDRVMVSTFVNVYAAGELRILLVVNVNAKTSFSNAVVANNVRNSILSDMDYTKQSIGGMVYLSDIYEAIETADGVRNSEVVKFVPVPYARALTTGSDTLNWNREIVSSSVAVNRWRIVFVTSTTYQVLRNGAFLGMYNVGDEVVTSDIKFTVNAGSYSSGDSWEFVTYPYNSTRIVLSEPSLPTFLSTDIILNVTGGF